MSTGGGDVPRQLPLLPPDRPRRPAVYVRVPAALTPAERERYRAMIAALVLAGKEQR